MEMNMAGNKGALMLSRSDISSLLQIEDYIGAMEHAFETYSKQKRAGMIGLLHLETGRMEYHIKAGAMELNETYFGLKVNSSLFSEFAKKGIPKIKGLIILFEGENGYPLAILDSIEITIKRTGATTAVAAKYLARKDSQVLTVCGCGNQGSIQLESLLQVLPIKQVFAFDMDPQVASRFAHKMSELHGIKIEAVENLEYAAARSDVITTCTPSSKAYLLEDYIRPGTFIAAVGADSAVKQELDPKILVNNKVVVDILDQSATVGELHHAIEAGLLKKSDAHGEVGDVITGAIAGRSSDEEIIIYDATGTAIQDTAAAASCYQKAIQSGIGKYFNVFE